MRHGPLHAHNDDKFIQLFVHEMYAVLLVIGTTEIIFHKIRGHGSSNELSWDITGIAGALLVLWVVVSYWWDWATHIEKTVGTTRRELFIDFSVLINLEFMFAYSDRPLVLAMLFVSLTFLDLLWVINHVFELTAIGEPVQWKMWICDKVIALGLYGLVFGLAWYCERVNPIVFVVVLAATFGGVRWLLFGQVRKLRGLNFRTAEQGDIPQIVAIHNSNVLKQGAMSGGGFVLTQTTEDELQKSMADQSNCYFVAVDQTTMLGYVATSAGIPSNVFDGVQWKSDNEKRLLCGDRHVYIAHAAVSPLHMGRGVGQFLYNQLYQHFSHSIFSAFIVTKPFRNSRSLTFHKRQGFIRWGYFSSKQFAGVQDYESELFVKDTWPKR